MGNCYNSELPAGPAGQTGPQGPKGDQGNIGPAGPIGLPGSTDPLIVFDGLVADNTTMEDTTLVLGYGVSIITIATATDYACRLPVPVTGKRTIVTNHSSRPISVFPDYNLGPDGYLTGAINGLPTGTPVILPPNNLPYEFFCIENPLPGAWMVSAPAIAQYDSGEITTDTIPGSLYSAAAANLVAENEGYYSNTAWGYNGLNNPSLPLVIYSNVGTPDNFVAFKPNINWNVIVKIKVYTNLAWYAFGTSNPQFGLTAGGGFSSYNAGGTFIGFTPGTTAWAGNYNIDPAYTECNNMVPFPVPTPPLAEGTLLPNIGDPGSAWGELVVNFYGPNGSRVGTFYEGLDSNGNDHYFTQMINFQINPFLNDISLTGFKFRFFLEYF